MGCDIHAYRELRHKDGTWHCYGELRITRNYSLFGYLAGVRSTPVKQLAPVRGLPTDLSVVVQSAADQWEGGGHTHSWLTMVEVDQLETYCVKQGWCDVWDPIAGYLFGNAWNPESLGRSPFVDARLVFWFDN